MTARREFLKLASAGVGVGVGVGGAMTTVAPAAIGAVAGKGKQNSSEHPKQQSAGVFEVTAFGATAKRSTRRRLTARLMRQRLAATVLYISRPGSICVTRFT